MACVLRLNKLMYHAYIDTHTVLDGAIGTTWTCTHIQGLAEEGVMFVQNMIKNAIGIWFEITKDPRKLWNKYQN